MGKSWHKNRIFAGLLIIVSVAVILVGCAQTGNDEYPVISSEATASGSSEAVVSADSTGSSINEEKISEKGDAPGGLNLDEDKSGEAEKAMRLYINDEEISVTWEDNESVSALRELVSDEPLRIEMSMYGGFEQVGSIGQSLPRNDKQITTESGDIVLYSGNRIVVFYGSNSWSYTKLGHIEDKAPEELTQMLSEGDVTLSIGFSE